MFRKIFPVLLALAIFLTACGPQGTPTMSAEDVQGTAVSSAWTMVAMTQLAIPTNTPTETPSPTPLPTFTPLPSPTLESTPLALPTATTASASGSDNCVKPLNIGAAGPQSEVRFENQTEGTVTLSLNLSTNAFGECGSLSYNLGKNEKLVLSLPKGVYFAWAWITFKNGSTGTASGSVNNRVGDDHQSRVLIKKDTIIVP